MFSRTLTQSFALAAASLILGACAASSAELDASQEDVGATSEALTSSETVLGFESASAWIATTGTKTLVTDGVDGGRALQLANFSYAELSSVATTWSEAPSDSIALEFKAPAGTSYGTIQLVAHAPSVGMYEQTLGSVSINADRSGDWTTLIFPVNAVNKTALGKKPADLVFRLRLTLPSSAAGYKFDRLHYYRPANVQVRANQADDYLNLHVNGIRHSVATYGSSKVGQWQDVSSWFRHGINSARIQVENGGGPGTYEFEMMIDGVIVSSLSCAGGTCLDKEDRMIARVDVPLPWIDRPESIVKLTSNGAGKIYVNDEYIGISTPATLRLPSGSYRIGLGQSNDTPGAYTGKFFEKTVNVGTGGQTVNLTSGSALPTQSVSKIAILPVKNFETEKTHEIAVLTKPMIDRFVARVDATRSKVIKPLSYGLTDWQVSVLPTENEITEVDGQVLANAKYSTIFSQYNAVFMLVSAHNAAGNPIEGTGGGAWASGGNLIHYPETWAMDAAADVPMEGLVHEALHLYEQDKQSLMQRYKGIQGLHGAEEHGYGTVNGSWYSWYLLFGRGQVGEIFDMSTAWVSGESNFYPAPVNSNVDAWVGTFESLRYGLDSSIPQ
jgi:hypothetical protein